MSKPNVIKTPEEFVSEYYQLPQSKIKKVSITSLVKCIERYEKHRIKISGKCPKDGVKNRPIYITINNNRTLAVADGMGHAYRVYGNGCEVYGSICKQENKYDPDDYEFERGLNGMDF